MTVSYACGLNMTSCISSHVGVPLCACSRNMVSVIMNGDHDLPSCRPNILKTGAALALNDVEEDENGVGVDTSEDLNVNSRIQRAKLTCCSPSADGEDQITAGKRIAKRKINRLMSLQIFDSR